MPSEAMLMTTTEPWVSVEDVSKRFGVAACA